MNRRPELLSQTSRIRIICQAGSHHRVNTVIESPERLHPKLLVFGLQLLQFL